MNRMLIAAALAAMATAACGADGVRIAGSEDGPTRILLTDAPFPYDTVERVDMYIVRVDVATTVDTTAANDWRPVSEPYRRFNLLDLQSGVTTLLGSSAVHFGGIAMVRVVINTDSSRVVYAGGGEAAVQWGAVGESAIHAAVEQPLVNWDSETGDIVLDFDVGRSFNYTATGFVFIPWIRAVNAAAAASIGGTVRRRLEADALAPAANAIVEAYREYGDGGPSRFLASTRTSADGSYTLRYLNAGTYFVQATLPGIFGSVAVQSGPVTVLMGDEGRVDLNLPLQDSVSGSFLVLSGPYQLALGDTAWYAATVINGADSVITTITWTVADPSIASLTATSGSNTGLVGQALGSTWLVGVSDSLVDSLVVAVVSSDSTGGGGGGGGPVASVTVSPASATVSVGDSLGFYATLKDSTGAVITGRAVTWSVSDSSVVQVFGVFGQSLILKALQAGTATVTATSEGKSGSGAVTVN